MGTRGTIKLKASNKKYKTYNHWDSYPSGLGMNLITQLKTLLQIYSIVELRDKISSLKLVSQDKKPEQTDIDKLIEYTDLSVSTQSLEDWYCLLRNCQGNIEKILESGYVLTTKGKQEYNYIIDFDSQTFTVEELNKTWSLSDLNIIELYLSDH